MRAVVSDEDFYEWKYALIEKFAFESPWFGVRILQYSDIMENAQWHYSCLKVQD